jgi:uncharacterized membrane protein YeaQ/YmgE (transglycosylase-associated protein family)
VIVAGLSWLTVGSLVGCGVSLLAAAPRAAWRESLGVGAVGAVGGGWVATTLLDAPLDRGWQGYPLAGALVGALLGLALWRVAQSA